MQSPTREISRTRICLKSRRGARLKVIEAEQESKKIRTKLEERLRRTDLTLARVTQCHPVLLRYPSLAHQQFAIHVFYARCYKKRRMRNRNRNRVIEIAYCRFPCIRTHAMVYRMLLRGECGSLEPSQIGPPEKRFFNLEGVER